MSDLIKLFILVGVFSSITIVMFKQLGHSGIQPSEFIIPTIILVGGLYISIKGGRR